MKQGFSLSMPVVFVCGLIVFAMTAPAHAGSNWPQFRGADSRGVSHNDDLPDTWSETENVEWSIDIPGRGWSSPIVWGNRVYLTTAVSEKELEAAKMGLYFGGERPKPDTVLQLKVIALDIATGKTIWDKTVHEGEPSMGIHMKNTFASETPTTDGERIYATFGNVGVFCLDMDGTLLWEKRLAPEEMRYGWGPAASPTLYRDRLYVVNDNEKKSYLMALDSKTGEEVWRVDRDEGSNWATPYAWEHDGGVEIVTPGTAKARSYDLDGNLLWSLKGMSTITIAMPYEHEGLLYVTSGWIGDPVWRPIYAIRPGARGDISLKEGETSNDAIAWCQRLAAPYNPSTIIYDGRLYVLYDRGFVSCFDAKTGEQIYDRERIRRGRGFTSSPWAYGGKIFFLNEHGDTFVVKAGDTFEILRTNSLAEGDMGMATPALSGDRLIIRTAARLYCMRNALAGG